MTEEIFVTKSLEETQRLARKLAIELRSDEVIALFGNLGSGKTTFVQGLAKGLGISGRMISPTFIIVREHKFQEQHGLKKFYHVDLYRVQKIDGLGLEEILSSKNRVIAIEWAEKIKNLLPKKRIEIYFEHLPDNGRRIILKRYE